MCTSQLASTTDLLVVTYAAGRQLLQAAAAAIANPAFTRMDGRQAIPGRALTALGRQAACAARAA